MASESEAKPKPPALVLSIDQAEELFLPEGLDEAQPFLALLRELLNADTPAVVAVLTIRTDQYELLQVAKELQVTRQEMLSLPPMPKGSFAEVVKEPARRLEGTPRALDVEDALVDALLADSEAGETKDALPLLAFTLERLYSEYQASGTLKLAQYNALGRVKGSIEAAVERALKAADSDPAIPKDRVTRLALLRRGLIPWLAGVDPDTGLRRRRVARLSEIPAESRPLIQHLVEQRLLATDVNKDTGKLTIEPAHEALLRQWSLLGGWLTEDSVLLAVLERIKRSSADWAANNKHRAWLTHGGDRLATAERLSARPDLAANLEPTDLAYIAACRKAEADAKSRKVRGLVFTYVLLLIAIASLLAYIFRSDIRRDYRYVTVTGPYLLSQVRPYVLTAAKEQALKPGNSFSECAPPVAPLTSLCPEMVVVPAGSFKMGATDKDPSLQPDEEPQHPVTIAEPLAISRTEVTFDQWNACITGGGCTYKPNDQGWKGGLQPVINVNLKDAEQYTAWLSEVTGKTYRLLSEAEYEYAERAGTETIYPWGNDIELNGIPMANCIGCDATWGGKQTAPVGSYPKNSFGLQDMAGNVWEWTEDCDHPNYNGAPTDGSAWVDGGDCDNHMVRGGVWVLGKDDVRAAYREPTATVDRGRDLGFRVARTLPVP